MFNVLVSPFIFDLFCEETFSHIIQLNQIKYLIEYIQRIIQIGEFDRSLPSAYWFVKISIYTFTQYMYDYQ